VEYMAGDFTGFTADTFLPVPNNKRAQLFHIYLPFKKIILLINFI
jgi:hypothetical protein